MRILIDESIPIKLGFALPGHFVCTVQLMGRSGLVNGKLSIDAAEATIHPAGIGGVIGGGS
jgi:predicted nuclease of predicted toxin-antitoxin system